MKRKKRLKDGDADDDEKVILNGIPRPSYTKEVRPRPSFESLGLKERMPGLGSLGTPNQAFWRGKPPVWMFRNLPLTTG